MPATRIPGFVTLVDLERFMARLGLAPVATYRAAPTTLLRNRISRERGQVPDAGRNRVLAARRSLRRSRGADRLPPLPEGPVVPD